MLRGTLLFKNEQGKLSNLRGPRSVCSAGPQVTEKCGGGNWCVLHAYCSLEPMNAKSGKRVWCT
jgi:hypothetical protein